MSYYFTSSALDEPPPSPFIVQSKKSLQKTIAAACNLFALYSNRPFRTIKLSVIIRRRIIGTARSTRPALRQTSPRRKLNRVNAPTGRNDVRNTRPVQRRDLYSVNYFCDFTRRVLMIIYYYYYFCIAYSTPWFDTIRKTRLVFSVLECKSERIFDRFSPRTNFSTIWVFQKTIITPKMFIGITMKIESFIVRRKYLKKTKINGGPPPRLRINCWKLGDPSRKWVFTASCLTKSILYWI